MLSILHHIVQSINKLLEFAVLLHSELKEWMFLCFSKHWLKEMHIKLINTDKFKLISNFSRKTSDCDGSCIYVSQHLHTKEVNYLQGIIKQKDLEISATELPDGDFCTFLSSLGLITQKVQARKKWLIILCGDWNKFYARKCKTTQIREIIVVI